MSVLSQKVDYVKYGTVKSEHLEGILGKPFTMIGSILMTHTALFSYYLMSSFLFFNP